MITNEQCQHFKEWFEQYAHSFLTGNFDFDQGFELKIIHTQKVCSEIIELCKSLSLDEAKTNIAFVIALFHDLGRFEQYKKYQTFNDSVSVNHAALGIQILKEKSILKNLDSETEKIIIKSINRHNAISLGTIENADELLFAQLIRDADKLDIFRLCCEEYMQSKYDSAIGLGLPNSPDVSEKVFHHLMSEIPINYKDLKTYTDFKLIKFGWLTDVNFSYSFKTIKERNYLEIIYQSIPENEKSRLVYEKYKMILENKIFCQTLIN